MVEEVVVQTIETPFFVLRKCTIHICRLGCDAWMIFVLLAIVLDKEYLVEKPHQPVTNSLVADVGVVYRGKMFLNFALGVEFRFH